MAGHLGLVRAVEDLGHAQVEEEACSRCQSLGASSKITMGIPRLSGKEEKKKKEAQVLEAETVQDAIAAVVAVAAWCSQRLEETITSAPRRFLRK